MKKLMYILVILLSGLTFYITYINQNNNDVAMLQISNELVNENQSVEIYIKGQSRDVNQLFLERLIGLCNENNYILVSGQRLNIDENIHKEISYIYDNNNVILKFLKDNLGTELEINSFNDGYITTDLNDKNANGYLKITDQKYLGNNIFEYTGFDEFINELESVNDDIIYDIYGADSQLIASQINNIAKGLIEYEVLESNDVEINETIDFNIYIILSFVVIALMICMINEFIGLEKEISVIKLLGYDRRAIFKNLFLKFIITFILIFVFVYFILWLILVHNLSVSGIRFIKLLSFNQWWFIIISIIVILGSYLLLVRNFNLKKAINYENLIKTSFIFKNIIIILLSFVLFYSLSGVISVFVETKQYFEKKDIVKNYYMIENLVDGNNTNNVIDILLEQKNAVACFFYSDANEITELPYIIVNKNYLNIFNDDFKNLNTPALLVPEIHKDKSIEQYRLVDDCPVYYYDNHYTYYNLISNSRAELKDPVVMVVDENYYSFSHILLSKEKSISYYTNLISDYIKSNEIRLVDANSNLETIFKYYTLPAIVRVFSYLGIYLIIYLTTLYIYMKLSFRQNAKEIAVKKSIGYNFFQRYKNIYLLNIFSYLLPFIVNICVFKINILSSLIITVILIIFEIIIESIMMKVFDHQATANLIKGSE